MRRTVTCSLNSCSAPLVRSRGRVFGAWQAPSRWGWLELRGSVRFVIALVWSCALVWACRVGTAQTPPLRYYSGNTASVYDVAYTPDGKTLVSVGVDGSLRFWDRATGQPIGASTVSARALLSLAVTHDGQRVAVGGLEPKVRLFDVPNTQPMYEPTGLAAPGTSLTGTGDGQMVVSGDATGIVAWWDLAKKTAVRNFTGSVAPIGGVGLVPASHQVVAVGGDGGIRGWNWDDGQVNALVQSVPVHDLAISPDRKTLALAGRDGHLRLVPWPPPAVRAPLTLSEISPEFALSADGQMLALGGPAEQVTLHSAKDGQLARALTGMTGRVTALSFSPDGKLVAAGGSEGGVRFWQTSDGAPAGQIGGHGGAITTIAWHPRGELVATSSADGTVRTWQMPTPVQVLAGHTAAVQFVGLAGNGERAVTAGLDQSLRRWDLKTGQSAAVVEKHAPALSALAVSRDGETAVTGDVQGALRGWSTADGKLQWTIGGHRGPIHAIAVDAAGQQVVTAGEDGSVNWWRPADARSVRLTAPSATPSALALTRDGNVLATGDDAGGVSLLNVRSGKVARRFESLGAKVTALRWAPDQSLLIVADRTGKTTFRNPVDGESQGWVGGHDGAVLALGWHPKEPQWISAGEDGTIRVWRRPEQSYRWTRPAAGAAGPAKSAGNASVPSHMPISAAANGQLLAAGFSDGSLQLWTGPTLKPAAAIPPLRAGAAVTSVATRRDGGELSTGDMAGRVRVTSAEGASLAELATHDGAVTTVGYHPQGHQLVTGGADGFVKTWQLPVVPPLSLSSHEGAVESLVVSADATRVFTVAADRSVHGFDLQAQLPLFATRNAPAPFTSLTLTVDNTLIVAGDTAGNVRILRAADGLMQHAVGGHVGAVRGVASRPQGGQLASIGADGDIRLWDAPTAPRVLDGHTAAVAALAVSPSGQLIATGGPDRTARLWNLADGTANWTLVHPAAISALAWRSDSTQIATGSPNRQVRIWSAIDGQQLRMLAGHNATITAVTFLPDGSIASAGADGRVKFWHATEDREIAELEAHAKSVTGMAVVATGQQLATASEDGTVRTWQLADRKPLQTIPLGATVQSLAATPDGKLLVVATGDKRVRVVQVADGKQVATLAESRAAVVGATLSNDGQRVVVATADGVVRVLALDGKPIESLDVSPARPTSVAFAPDQRSLVITSSDAQVRVVRLSLQKTIHVADKPLNSLTYTPDGSSLLIAGEGLPAALWNLTTGMMTRAYPGTESAQDLVLSPDGTRLYTLGADKQVRVMQVADGAAVATWPQPARLRRVRLSRDGTRMLLGTDDGDARLLETTTGRMLQRWELARGAVNGLVMLPDNRTIVLADHAGQVQRVTASVLVVASQHPGGVTSAMFAPNGQAVLSAGADKGARISDLNGKVMVTLAGCDAVINAVSMRGDGAQIAAVAQDSHLYIWPNGNGQLERRVAIGAPGQGIAYSPDETRVVIPCGDHVYRVFQLLQGKLAEMGACPRGCTTVAWLPPQPAATDRPALPDRLAMAGVDQTLSLQPPLLVRLIVGHMGAVTSLAVTPDGTGLVSAGADKSVRVWNLGNGQPLRTLGGPTEAVTGVALSNDGSRIVAAGADKVLRAWNYADGAVVANIPLPAATRLFATSGNANRCVTAGDDHVVRIWHLPTARQIEHFAAPGAVTALAEGDGRAIAWASADKEMSVVTTSATAVASADTGKLYSVALSPDGALAATCGDDRVVKLWKSDGTLVRPLNGSPAPWRRLAFRADGKVLAAGVDVASKQPIVFFWKTDDGQILPPLTTPSPVVALALGGVDRIAVAGVDQHVRIYSMEGNRLLQDFVLPAAITELRFADDGKTVVVSSSDQHGYVLKMGLESIYQGHRGVVLAVGFDSKGELLQSVGDDLTVRQWSAAGNKVVSTLEGAIGPRFAITNTAEGRLLVTSAPSNVIKCWDGGTGRELEQFPMIPAPFVPTSNLKWTDGGRQIVYAAADKTLRWLPHSVMMTPVVHPAGIHCVRFARDGRLVFTSGADQTVRSWEMGSNAAPREFIGDAAPVRTLDVSSDGRTLAMGVGNGDVILWSTRDVRRGLTIKTPHAVHSLRFSDRGARLLVGNADGVVRSYSVASATAATNDAKSVEAATSPATMMVGPPIEYRGHVGAVVRIDLSEDESTMTTVGDDRTIRRWQLTSSQPRRAWDGTTGPTYGLAFAPDDTQLAAATGDGQVTVWSTADGSQRWSQRHHAAAAQAVAFLPNGSELSSVGADGKLILWSATGEVVRSATTEAGRGLHSIVVDPKGERLATGGAQRQWQWWERGTLQPGPVAAGHNDTIYRLAMRRDGARLASLDFAGHLFVWNTADNRVLWHTQLPVTAATAVAFAPAGDELAIAARDRRIICVTVPDAAR